MTQWPPVLTWTADDGNGLIYGSNSNVNLHLRVFAPSGAGASGGNVIIKAERSSDSVTPDQVDVIGSGSDAVVLRVGPPGTTGVTATVGSSTARMAIEVADPDASRTTLTLDPETVVAGEQSALATLWAKDGKGRNLAGVAVEVSSEDPNMHLSPERVVTSRTGKAVFSVLGFKAGTQTVDVAGNGFSFSPALTVTPAGLASTSSCVTLTPEPGTPSAPYAATVAVRSHDAYGNPIEGVAITLTTGARACALGATQGVSDATGRFTTTLSCTAAGLVTVVAESSPKLASSLTSHSSITFRSTGP